MHPRCGLPSSCGERPETVSKFVEVSPMVLAQYELILGGAYRLHRPEDIEPFTALAAEAFPQLAARIKCFASDWLGRQFAQDNARVIDGEPQILLLEPGTGEAVEIPCDYAAFHKQELVEFPDAAVSYGFFQDWLASGGTVPDRVQCVGYRIPLYLGGADDLSNLALQDLAVYWTVCGQILAQIRDHAVGTVIGNVSIS